MVLLAKRVSAFAPAPISASRLRTPMERAAAAADWKISSAYCRVRSADSWMLLAGICATDPDVAKARRARAMSGSHHLFRLPLSTIRRPPQRPVLRAGDGRAGIPE